MLLIRMTRSLGYPVTLIIVAMAMFACSVPQEPSNRYQSDTETTQLEARPVAELHNQALAALNQNQNQQAIDYLQRAIKIQPRNAWSWHYLAQSYSQDTQYDRCLAMIERSISYGASDNVLEHANTRLKNYCQQW